MRSAKLSSSLGYSGSPPNRIRQLTTLQPPESLLRNFAMEPERTHRVDGWRINLASGITSCTGFAYSHSGDSRRPARFKTEWRRSPERCCPALRAATRLDGRRSSVRVASRLRRETDAALRPFLHRHG